MPTLAYAFKTNGQIPLAQLVATRLNSAQKRPKRVEKAQASFLTVEQIESGRNISHIASI